MNYIVENLRGELVSEHEYYEVAASAAMLWSIGEGNEAEPVLVVDVRENVVICTYWEGRRGCAPT